MKVLLSSLLLILTLSLQAQASPRVCLLNFERSAHPISRDIKKTIGSTALVKVIHEAKPSDILDCLQEGRSKIVILAHAVRFAKSPTLASLGYFDRLQGTERENYIQDYLDDLAAKLQVLKDSRSRKSQERILQMQKDYDFVKSYQQNEKPLYSPVKRILPQVFRRLVAELKEMGVEQSQLKTISFISCEPSQIRRYYPELKELKAMGIKVRFAPKSQFWSRIQGQSVVHYSPAYLQSEVYSD